MLAEIDLCEEGAVWSGVDWSDSFRMIERNRENIRTLEHIPGHPPHVASINTNWTESGADCLQAIIFLEKNRSNN